MTKAQKAQSLIVKARLRQNVNKSISQSKTRPTAARPMPMRRGGKPC